MLTAEGHIKVFDFGVPAEGVDDHYGLRSTFCGTCEFMAPEVCFCGNYSRLFSLGDLMGSADPAGQEVWSRS